MRHAVVKLPMLYCCTDTNGTSYYWTGLKPTSMVKWSLLFLSRITGKPMAKWMYSSGKNTSPRPVTRQRKCSWIAIIKCLMLSTNSQMKNYSQTSISTGQEQQVSEATVSLPPQAIMTGQSRKSSSIENHIENPKKLKFPYECASCRLMHPSCIAVWFCSIYTCSVMNSDQRRHHNTSRGDM